MTFALQILSQEIMKKPKKEIRTEIVINAPAQKIWSLLIQFENYSRWNPFIKEAKGRPVQGEQIFVRIEPPGAKGMSFRPRLLKVDQGKELRWLGKLFITGLFDGEHIFELQDAGNGTTRFIQRELFYGLLVPLFNKMLDNNTREGFEMMNRRLKELAEAA